MINCKYAYPATYPKGSKLSNLSNIKLNSSLKEKHTNKNRMSYCVSLSEFIRESDHFKFIYLVLRKICSQNTTIPF
ncbi:unnamed protein product [Trifolium pratense]|uniref:Uncharacterized protein n=1 Tax=Trifolium pratense TaxID=57577 RepID=A0ACB0KKL5_TRIPR|nr:unnamed protein product [Trifolium pratense]